VSAYYNEHDPFAAAWLRNLISAGRIAAGDEDRFRDGKRHREDGPAWERTGADGEHAVEFYRDGKLHREDGPAREWTYANGTHEVAYYRDGKRVEAPKEARDD